MIRGEEQEVFAIGQELWPALGCVLGGIHFGELCRNSTSRADSPQRLPVIGLKDDDVVLVPGAASRIRRIGKSDDRPACCRNFFQMAISKEAQEFSVAGPEGKTRSFGSLEFFSGKVTERLHPDCVPLFRGTSAESECQTIGRNCGWT